MMPKVGMSAQEIADTSVVSLVQNEWLREIAWQLTKLRESLPTEAYIKANMHGTPTWHAMLK